jgi:hypothetical protein
MPRAKRSLEAAVTLDGLPLIWHLHREQQWCTADGWKGVAIHVKMAEGAHRELILEYPTVRTLKPGYSQRPGYSRTDPVRPTIVAAKVTAHIRDAMAAGWNPESRGKPFVYQVPELPN